MARSVQRALQGLRTVGRVRRTSYNAVNAKVVLLHSPGPEGVPPSARITAAKVLSEAVVQLGSKAPVLNIKKEPPRGLSVVHVRKLARPRIDNIYDRRGRERIY